MTDPKPLTEQQLADIEAAWRLGDVPTAEQIDHINRTADLAGLDSAELKAVFRKGFSQE